VDADNNPFWIQRGKDDVNKVKEMVDTCVTLTDLYISANDDMEHL